MTTVRSLLPLMLALASCITHAAAPDTPIARAAAFLASQERAGEPGCAVGVLQDGRWVFKDAYGLADLESKARNTPDLVFGVASITKQFTAAAVAIAASQKYFSLDDDIRKYLPEMPDYGRAITIAELVYHTDGIRDHGRLVGLTGNPKQYETQAARVALLARQRALNFEPGTQYLYGNGGYLLLAEIIQRTTGQPLAAYAEQNIFRPLGMKHTYFGAGTRGTKGRALPYSRTKDGWRNTDGEAPAHFGSGGLMTTLDDYAKWANNLFASRSGLAGGTALTKQLHTSGRLRDGTAVHYGFGLRLNPYRGIEQVGHSGSGEGYKALAMMFPQRKLGVFGFCNNGVYAQEVVMAVADLFLGLPPQGKAAGAESSIRLTRAQLDRFAGVYREPELRLPMLVSAGDNLLVVDGDAKRYEFLPLAPTRFRNEENIIIEFGGPADTALTLRQVEGRKYGSGVFARVQPVSLTPTQMATYAGDYLSTELNATYRFSVHQGQLTARIVEQGADAKALRFAPLLQDEFYDLDNRMVVRFKRDRADHIAGLDLTNQFGWIKDVAFERVTADGEAEQVVAWSAQHAVGFGEDLSPLKRVVGNARVLAFGEGTHNASELWTLRNRMFAYAVEQLGFTAIAAETSVAEGWITDDYVTGKSNAIDAATHGVFSWTAASFEENRALIEWMRAYNAKSTTARKIRFYGLEMSGSTRPDGRLLVQPAIDYMRTVDAKRAQAVESQFSPLLPIFNAAKWLDAEPSKQDQLVIAAQDLVSLFERYQVLWTAKSSRDAYQRAYRHAIASRQLVAHVRMKGQGRDIAAAENLRWVLEQEGPKGRVFVFAHNSHVAKWRMLPADDAELHSTMSEFIHPLLGNDMVVIASLYHRGETRDWLGMFGFDNQLRKVPPSKPESLNGVMSRVGKPSFLLDLRALPKAGPVRDWFEQPRPVRNINVREEYNQIKPAAAFDALLYIDAISPLHPAGK
ncbi:serine hydrolase [Steroidobacter flavus]|uniref:Serine hydrolase n=1 Tax=Steroidobacter flavus TaxID=1842136 RepID=A0ABV8SZQ6_9GAMM